MAVAAPLPTEPDHGVWNVVHSTVHAFWAPVAPRIHAAAEAQTVPVELYCAVEQLDRCVFLFDVVEFPSSRFGRMTCQTAQAA